MTSWNEVTRSGKGTELVKTVIRRRINIACLQETKWGESREIENTGYRLQLRKRRKWKWGKK